MTITTGQNVGVRPLADDLREYADATPRSRQSDDARDAGKIGLGPSDYGRCRAQIAYRERPPADYVPDPITKDAAIVGTLIHEGITARRAALYPQRQHNLAISVPGLDSEGHADEYDPDTATLVDFKSAGDWVWERVSTGRADGMPGDWGQILIYGLGLRAQGAPVEKLRLVYIWRDKGHTVEFERPYDEDEALAALAWMHDVMDALEAGEEPGSPRLPRDRRGPTLDPICAKHCPAVRHCWQLEQVPEGRSPESWVIVGDDAEKASAVLADWLEAKAAVSKAGEVVDGLKALLAGLPPGVYPGGLVLDWIGGSAGKWGDDPEKSIALLREKIAEQHAAWCERWHADVQVERALHGVEPDPVTDDLRAAWLAEGREIAAAVVLPQRKTGARAASAKVTRITTAAAGQ